MGQPIEVENTNKRTFNYESVIDVAYVSILFALVSHIVVMLAPSIIGDTTFVNVLIGISFICKVGIAVVSVCTMFFILTSALMLVYNKLFVQLSKTSKLISFIFTGVMYFCTTRKIKENDIAKFLSKSKFHIFCLYLIFIAFYLV